MRISQRLYLAVVPAILGVFTVAGLAYWGAYHRAAPEWVVVAAAVSAIVSLILAWQNTRYVARRIERLVGVPASNQSAGVSPFGAMRSAALPKTRTGPDELDSIEEVVEHLSSAVQVAHAGGEARERAAADRMREYAVLLDETSAAVRRQLGDARMALRILLDHHFGPLNGSQDEMLEAARVGTDAAEVELSRLQEISQLDHGALHVRRDPLRIGKLVQSLRPQLEADGVKAGITLAMDVPPGLPRILGDRIRLQQAIELLLRHLVRHATPGAVLSIEVESILDRLHIVVTGGRPPTPDADVTLALRIITAHGGRIDITQPGSVIDLPVDVEPKAPEAAASPGVGQANGLR